MSETTPTPIQDILGQGRGGEASPAEPQQQVQPSATDTDPQDIPLYDEGPADGATDPQAYRGVRAALKAEREQRRAFAARNRELEEALVVLHTAAQEREPQRQDGFWDDPERRLVEHSIQTNFRASRAEYVAEHGREHLGELDHAIEQAMRANHPHMPALSQRMREVAAHGGDPIALASAWAADQGLLSGPDNSGVSRTLARGPTFPTALESVRNVGARRGPAWTGPTPLQDIFKR